MSTTPRRVALVTGGSRGIGRAVSIRLAADGFTVVVNHASGTAAAEDTVAEIERTGGRGVAVQADVADEHAVAAMFDRVEAEHGGVDVVVHSAAGRLALSTIADQDLDVLDALHRRTSAAPSSSRSRLPVVSGRRGVRRHVDVGRGDAVPDLRRLRREQERGRGHDDDPREGAPRPGRHGERGGPGADGDRDCSSTARRRTRSTPWRRSRPSNGSACRRTSPVSSRSSPGPTGTGSTARPSAPTAGWSDADAARSSSSRARRAASAG